MKEAYTYKELELRKVLSSVRCWQISSYTMFLINSSLLGVNGISIQKAFPLLSDTQMILSLALNIKNRLNDS